MMNIFLLFALSTSYTQLPLDDTYHNVVLDEQTKEAEFLVQGLKDEAAVLIVMDNETNFKVTKKNYGEDKFVESGETIPRGDDHFTKVVKHDTDEYFYLNVKCEKLPCQFTVRNVHTAPVYRVSAVLGSFTLFICLFLLVFAWTIFCGACRAERKR